MPEVVHMNADEPEPQADSGASCTSVFVASRTLSAEEVRDEYERTRRSPAIKSVDLLMASGVAIPVEVWKQALAAEGMQPEHLKTLQDEAHTIVMKLLEKRALQIMQERPCYRAGDPIDPDSPFYKEPAK